VSDNRRAARHPVDLPCTLVDERSRASHETRIVNLSLGGALVTNARLPMGHRVHLSFHVPTLAPEAIAIGAVVRWSTDLEIGVQFDGLRPKETWALSKFFDSL